MSTKISRRGYLIKKTDNNKDQILKNSPDNNEEFFIVPKVVE